MDFLKEIGPTLIDHGFNIVPIKRGFKHPEGLVGWRTAKAATLKDLKRWSSNGFAGGGVGINTTNNPAIDLDIYDEDIVDEMVSFCTLMFGTAPQRTGLAPKTLLAYRTDEPFSKLTSQTFVDPLGFEHRVEILGRGQQFVAYAEHPNTKRPYIWHDGRELADINSDELPVINRDTAYEVIEHFESIIPDDWQVSTKSGAALDVFDRKPSAAPDDDPFASLIPKTDLTDQQILYVLENLKELADDRDMWILVGMGLHHQYDGSDEGLEIWNEWSQNSNKYVEGEPDKKWSGFSIKTPRTRPTTFASVLKVHNKTYTPPSKRSKPRLVRSNDLDALDDADNVIRVEVEKEIADPIERFLDQYVFVEIGNKVADLKKPPQYALSKIEEFRNKTANVQIEVPAPTKIDPDKVKFVPVSSIWLCHQERKTAQEGIYSPLKGRYFIDENGLKWINTFHMPVFNQRDGDLAVFLEHMDYLFPHPEERKWFIDWMAFNLQYPGKRSKVTPLHISIHHGTGRGWVVELMGHLLGQWNCTKTKMDVLSGEGSAGQYQDYLADSLLCCIEEVKESSKRYAVSDRIRDILTEEYLEVNLKFGSKSTRRIFTNFFLMSNHVDALVISPEDRRIQVLSGPKKVRDLAYYDRLYQWLTPENLGALNVWLRDRDITQFNWTRCVDTAGRRRMIDGNRTPTETAFWEYMASIGRTAVEYQDVLRGVQSHMESDGDGLEYVIDDTQIKRLLQQNATQSKQIKIDGKPIRPWLLGSWPEENTEEIRTFLTA